MQRGATLLEMVLVLSLLAIAAAIALPPFRRLLDGIGVRGAAAEVHSLFGTARHVAIHRSVPVTLVLDTARARVLLRAAGDTFRVRELQTVHGVRLHASRTAAVYTANGLGYGASNMTVVVSRGKAADTLTVSRLGRVRRNR